MSGLGILFMRRGIQAHPSAGADYIKFKDEAVFNLLMSKGISADGVGITKDDAAKVTTISTWFKNNNAITSFDEFVHFTSIESLEYQAFYGCLSLNSIAFPPSLKTSGAQTFLNDTALVNVNMGGLRDLQGYAMKNIGATFIELPDTIATIGVQALAFNKNLEIVIARPVTPPTIDTTFLAQCNKLIAIYVPDESLSAYLTAWSAYATKIKPLSEYQG